MHNIRLVVLFILLCEASNVTWHKFDYSEFYVATNSSANFDGALLSCTGMGATLAKVNSSNIQLFSASLTAPRKGHFIGLKGDPSPTNFTWLDGSILTWSNWRGGEPNNLLVSGNEDCVVMGAPWDSGYSFLWNDYPCYFSVAYICQRTNGLGTQSNTTNISTSGTEAVTRLRFKTATPTENNKDVTQTHKTTLGVVTTTVGCATSSPQTIATNQQENSSPVVLGALVASIIFHFLITVIAIYYRKKYSTASQSASASFIGTERQATVQYVNVHLAVGEKRQSQDCATINNDPLQSGRVTFQSVTQ